MSEDNLGSGNCYICKRPMQPLVSICWACGYSQQPNPNAQGDEAGDSGAPDATGAGDKASARSKLKSSLASRLGQGKDGLKSRLKKE